jgi:hypothetical protein
MNKRKEKPIKSTILFFITLLFAASVFGQEEEKVKKPFPISFDEFTISVNRTNMTMFSGHENRFGYGVGAYHSSVLSKRWNYMYGLEYNYTSLFVDDVPCDIILHRIEKNVTFHIHTVSLMPVAFRFSMGKNVKYFLESGAFLGVSTANKKGEAYIIDQMGEGYTPVDIGRDWGFNGGPSFGMGMRIPMRGIEWIIKTDYKLEMNRIIGGHQYYRFGVGIRTKR